MWNVGENGFDKGLARWGETLPQGLKPIFCGSIGTAEAVPFPTAMKPTWQENG